MEKPISVVLADSSEGFRRLLSEFIDAEEDMFVAASADNGLEAAERVAALRPDVLVTDLLLREMEGLELIRRLKEEGLMPHTIVVSGFFSDSLACQAVDLGVERFLPKPCRTGALIESIRECSLSPGGKAERVRLRREAMERTEREELAEKAVRSSGVMPHLTGYVYLRDAFSQIISDRSKLEGITKVLYPELARRHGTSAENVERCIRSALDLAWKDGSREVREEFFGPELGAALRKRPGNGRYMKTVMEYVDREMRKKKAE